MLSSLLVLLFY